MEQLLDATAAILDEEGLEGLTTNAIAARSGVNVASLYKYFPNKFAVLRALAERNMARQREVIGKAIADAEPSGDWRRAITEGIDAFVAHVAAEPGFAAVGDAIRATPALRELETAGMPAIIDLVEAAIRTQGVPSARKDARVIARVVVEAGAALLMSMEQDKPALRKRMVRELKRMLIGYLEPVFEESEER